MAPDTTKNTVISRRALHGTISNYAGTLIGFGISFFLTPFILHQLEPGGYGLWVVVGSVVAYGTLLNFGVSGAVIKYVAEHHAKGESEEAHSLVATALCLYSFLGLVTIALSIAIAPFFPDLFNVPAEQRATSIWLVRLMGFGVGLSIPCSTPAAVLWGLQRFDLNNVITIIGTVLTAAATVGVLLLGGGVLGMVAASISVMLMMQGPSIWFIHRIAPELRFGWRGARRSMVRIVMSFSWPIFVKSVSGRVQMKSDEIVIAAFLPISAVTPYAIARRLSEVALVLTDQFMKVLVPLASELNAKNDMVRLRSVYLTGTRVTLAIFLPLGCILVILARQILTMWVGVDYADYAHLVTILTVASLIDTSQWPGGSVLQGMSRHRLPAIISIGTGLANLALSIVLVRNFGLTGVALGTLLPTTVVCFGFSIPYAMRVIGVTASEIAKQVLLPALLPAIPASAVLYILQQVFEPSSLLSVMAVASFGLVMYLVGYFYWGASEIERQTCRTFALSTTRFADACFKRT